MFFTQLISELNNCKIPFAITGGYAVALHGVVRATMDVDLVITLNKDTFLQFAQCMKNLGLQSRIPIDPNELYQFREEYITQRNLIAWSFVNYKDPSQVVDVLLTEDLKKIKTKKINIGKLKVNIVSIEDLIRMKEISARPQDLVDIEKLKQIKS